ncbi:hypothetical protein LL127_09570 [Clostridium estertheticum]|uniref:hypothetical protein n=1 Tax=Clostridium estertheticum TaxID=238834 RepID=UPI001CF33F0D|nr:hypothetical protein [Clostridium estertheticum]MCB2306008.1 hypothetical protein [Clostridium estertheticum]MCB2346531.1 hypothetical protein [Clostridium estertheticum]WAG47660.1 hypothetical protein LL127_09570 [Clostridium estertheticum]
MVGINLFQPSSFSLYPHATCHVGGTVIFFWAFLPLLSRYSKMIILDGLSLDLMGINAEWS